MEHEHDAPKPAGGDISAATADNLEAARRHSGGHAPTQEAEEADAMTEIHADVTPAAMGVGGEMAQELKARFPWLGTEDHAAGAEVVGGLACWYQELTAGEPKLTRQEKIKRMLEADAEMLAEEGSEEVFATLDELHSGRAKRLCDMTDEEIDAEADNYFGPSGTHCRP